jgi:hypothetical protein
MQSSPALAETLGKLSRLSLHIGRRTCICHHQYSQLSTAATKQGILISKIKPNYAIAHQWHGEYLAALGHHEKAIATFRRAIELDALSLIVHATLGRHGYYFARQHDRALGWLHQSYADRALMMSELKVEPVFDVLRADPRFVDLLGRVGLCQPKDVFHGTHRKKRHGPI